MFDQILTQNQRYLLPLIRSFSHNFYLVDGTAITLHLGHRRSIDFDLFSIKSFDPMILRKKITGNYNIEHTFSQGEGELTVLINQVKVTFFHYPYKITSDVNYNDVMNLPDLLTLGAMKAFALGRRAKWKDYVDLYFIFRKYSLTKFMKKTVSIYGTEFNEKLFRTQLFYFEDIDYSEGIDFLKGYETADDEIRKYLTKISLS